MQGGFCGLWGRLWAATSKGHRKLNQSSDSMICWLGVPMTSFCINDEVQSGPFSSSFTVELCADSILQSDQCFTIYFFPRHFKSDVTEKLRVEGKMRLHGILDG